MNGEQTNKNTTPLNNKGFYWVNSTHDFEELGKTVSLQVYAYIHIRPDNKKLEIHTKIAENEEEFLEYYKRVKCL